MGYKIYEHVWASYFSTDITVDGKTMNIAFTGSSRNNPVKISAKFTTNSKAVQKAIEARDDFGKEIRLFQDCKENEEPRAVTIKKLPEKEPAPEPAPEPIPEPVGDSNAEETAVGIPEGFKAVGGISTAVEAKAYMLDNFSELKHGDLKNTAMIKEEAAKRNIIFTELA